MKCIYCHAEIEQSAQFCPYCGKDLSKFNKCIKCGELLDDGTAFCPNCGTEQTKGLYRNHSQDMQGMVNTLQPNGKRKTNKWIWIVSTILLLGLVIGIGCYGFNQTKQDVAPQAATDFIESMYKDFYEPYNLERSDKKLLSKYFTAEAMQKFYVESDYEDGEFFYCTDFLVNGDISGNASPDYGDKVISRTIEPENDGWFLVTNIWDVIQEPVKVHLQVKSIDGAFKVVDVSVGEKVFENNDDLDNNTSSSKEIITISQLRDGESIKDVLSSLEYRYKKVENDRGYVTVYWYKNCELDNQFEVIKPISKNAIVIEEFDGQDASVRITVYDVNVYENLKKQIIQFSQKKNNDEYHFDWGDGEYTQTCVSLGGKSEYRDGGYYVDIPLW